MSVDNLQLIFQDDTFLSYHKDGDKCILAFSTLDKFWDCASAEDVEGCSVSIDGDNIVGFMLTASGQGGLIFVWDTVSRKITHVSDGEYTVAVTRQHDWLFSLSVVSNYTTSAHFLLFKSRISEDIIKEQEPVKFQCECNAGEFDGNFSSIALTSEENKLSIKLNGKNYPITIIQ